jgi:hypothetical protein
MVEVVVTEEFAAWFDAADAATSTVAARLIDRLEEQGVALGAPYSSAIKGSRYALRELRGQGKPIRILYTFDPKRQAVVLIAGDKTGDDRFYKRLVPIAERIWEAYLRSP